MVKISIEPVRHILHEHLGTKKLSARWVPRSLTIDQKQQHVNDSERVHALFQSKQTEFLRQFVAIDETWTY